MQKLCKTFAWLLLIPSCTPYHLFKEERMLMGTFSQVQVYAKDAKIAKTLIDEAFKRMKDVEDIASFYKKDSALSILNKRGRLCPAPFELLHMLKECIKFSKLTNGAFDVTIAPLSALWKQCIREEKFPKETQIKKAKKFVGYNKIKIEKDCIYLDEGVKIDLGGVAKGYAVHKAASFLREKGVYAFLVEAGGDIEVGGRKSWLIGVRHPRKDALICTLKLKEGGVVTSGDYMQYFFYKGKRYHHIIDPRTGYPSKGFCSATVVAENAFLADIISTALCVLGEKESKEFFKNMKIGALCINEDGRLFFYNIKKFIHTLY